MNKTTKTIIKKKNRNNTNKNSNTDNKEKNIDNSSFDIIKEAKNMKIINYKDNVFINIFSNYRKNQLFKLINNINRYVKEKRIPKILQSEINETLLKYNFIFFNKKGIINNVDIFSKTKLYDFFIPILLPQSDKKELSILINHIQNTNNTNFIYKLSNKEKDFVNRINYIINSIFLQEHNVILSKLYKELLQSYEILKDIELKGNKKEGTIYYIKEKYRTYFGIIYKKKIYFFNVFLKNNQLILKKDSIYHSVYNKSVSILDNVEYYKIKKINKAMIEDILVKYYDVSSEYIRSNYILKSIFKQDIVKMIKEYY